MVLLSFVLACSGSKDEGPVIEEPGPVPAKALHRLNRAELDNAFRDLLATVESRPSSALPTDESTDGLDNIADALSVTVSHLAGLEIAVDTALDEYFGRDLEETVKYDVVHGTDAGVTYFGEGYQDVDPNGPPDYYYEPDPDVQNRINRAYIIQEGSVEVTQSTLYDGNFIIDSRLYSLSSTPAMVELLVDGMVVDTIEVTSTNADAPPEVFTEVTLEPGPHRFVWRLTNPEEADVGWLLYWIQGPTSPRTGPTVAYSQLFDCTPETRATCTDDILSSFATRAWRRALDEEDVAFVKAAFETADAEGLEWTQAMQHAFKVILLNPNFLYRAEQDPGGLFGRLTSYELASRLSFFLWSTIPDDDLLVAASEDALATDDGVLTEADRMLDDVRVDALINNFAGQWLDLRLLQRVQPSVVVYPEFNEALRSSMSQELRLLTQDFFADRITFTDMLRSEERWVNETLAAHYRVEWPGGDDGWVRTTVPNARPGFLGSAAWMTATSNPDSPNTVTRGLWVLERLLCSAPPGPPDDIDTTPIEPQPGSSVREQEEAQRSPGTCQGCHQFLDPIGFIAGEFDGIGMVRSEDELGFPIDTEAVFEGKTMSRMAELAEYVANDDRLPECFAEKVFSYAMGRTPVEEDEEALADITRQFVEGGLRFKPLARAIVTSRPFLNRSAPEAK
ncbi:MAG: DUF1592 domain-containing protein [Myxococcota bacterium]